VSTWTTGIRDAENAALLVERGSIRSLRLMTDRSFPTRQADYCARVCELFGPDAIVCTRTHAKFALIWNESWSVVIRSSMNLNRNPRFEQFDLDDSPELLAFFRAFVDDVARLTRSGVKASTSETDAAFEEALRVIDTTAGVMQPTFVAGQLDPTAAIPTADEGVTINEARRRREYWASENERLKALEKSAELTNAAKAEEDAARAFTMIRTAIEAIAPRISADLLGLRTVHEIRVKLSKAHDDVLRSVADMVEAAGD
jgi:hypothetical protein